MLRAIFTRAARNRVMHAVPVGETKTVCQLDTGAGTGLVYSGAYGTATPCARCWEVR